MYKDLKSLDFLSLSRIILLDACKHLHFTRRMDAMDNVKTDGALLPSALVNHVNFLAYILFFWKIFEVICYTSKNGQ